MAVAYNDQTGEAKYLDPQGQWQKSTIIKNDQTGEIQAYDGRGWKSVKAETPPDMQQKPGFEDAVRRGNEQFGLGVLDLGNKAAKAVGYDTGYGGAIAETAKQLEAQGKGTGVAGTLGEIAGNPLTYVGGMGVGGALMKAGTLGARMLGGAAAGAVGGAVGGALTPSTDKDAGLGEKATQAAEGGVVGGVIGAVLPGVSKTLRLDKIIADPNSVFAKALSKIGVDVTKFAGADKTQEALKGGFDRVTDDVTRFGRDFRPSEQSPTQVGQSLYENKAAQTAKKNNLYDEALSGAAEADATKASNYGEIENINGQITRELKGESAKSAQELRDQKLKAQGEINEQKQVILDLDKRGKGVDDADDAEAYRPETAARRASRRQEVLKLRQMQLDHANETISNREAHIANLDRQIEQAEKMENLPLRGGLPSKISTGQDLIRVLQVLNRRANNSNMSNLERETLDSQRAAVRSALDELSEGKDWGKTYKAADTEVQRIDELYNTPGGALKSLGLTDDLFNSMRRAKTPELKAAAEANIVQKLDGIADKITEKGQVDALKQAMTGNGLPRSAYESVMSKTIKAQLEKAGKDPEALAKARPLIDHILKNGIGIKDKGLFEKLDALQDVAKTLKEAQLDLKMPPAKYRDTESLFKRAFHVALAAVEAKSIVGLPWAAKNLGKALRPSDTEEAKLLASLRGKNTLGQTAGKFSRATGAAITDIPGQAIGAYTDNNK